MWKSGISALIIEFNTTCKPATKKYQNKHLLKNYIYYFKIY